MDLQRVSAIFEGIVRIELRRRQLARFTHYRNSASQSVRHRRTDKESTRFYPKHNINAPAVTVGNSVHGFTPRRSMRQQRSDVAEHDARLGKIGHVTNQAL